MKPARIGNNHPRVLRLPPGMQRAHMPGQIIARLQRIVKREIGLVTLHRQAGALGIIAAAVTATVRHRDSADERAHIQRIEDRRRQLAASTEEIAKLDYGALRDEAAADRGNDNGRTVHDTVGRITRISSKSPLWARLLFHLVRQLKPKVAVEMGTSVGISAAYQSAALQLNGAGRLITLEGAPTVADIARDNLERLGYTDTEVVTGAFRDTLAEQMAAAAPVDYLFVDGHHDGAATLAYYRLATRYLSDRAVVVFDDIRWSADMTSAWQDIVADPQICASIDLGPVGICLFARTGTGNGSDKRKRTADYVLPLF